MRDGDTFTIEKVDKKATFVIIYMLSLSLVVGTAVLIAVRHIQWGTILLWAMGISFACVVYNTKIGRQPRKILIKPDGLMLLFSNAREKNVSWSMLNGVHVSESSGAIKVVRELRYYPISREAAIGIQRAYLEQTGKAAPVWDGRSPLRR